MFIIDKIRQEFENVCQLPNVRNKVNFPLGTMTVNGKFHHYMDSDTDSVYIGFVLGFRRALQMDCEKE